MEQRGGYAYLLVTALAWGCNWPVMKLLMREWPVYSFRILAGAGAVALLFAIAARRGERLLPPPGQWKRVAAGGLLNVAAWSVVAPLALFWIDASEAAIIAYTMPVWATVLAWPVLGERPTPARLAGLALGLGGVVLLMAGQVSAAALAAKLPGVGLILLTALMFATGTVVTKRWPAAMPALPLVAWQLVLGLAPVVVLGLGFERVDWGRVTWLGWGCLVYVGGVAQVVAYLVWFAALKRLPASTAAVGSLLVPVVGVVSSGLVLGEPLGVRHALALGMTLGGVVVAGRG